MLAKLYSCAVLGLEGKIVEVEVDSMFGQSFFGVVGLPDAAVQEARERVKSAVKNSGFSFPGSGRLIASLAPADLRKEGPSYDLPIAVGVLICNQQISFNPEKKIFVGELALNGTVRSVQGVLPIALAAKQFGYEEVYVPEDNAAEAGLVSDINVYPVKNLGELARHLAGFARIKPWEGIKMEEVLENYSDDSTFGLDMALIKGQEQVKRVLEIAAAGAHNVLMSGPPGSGKTLLAKTFATILPPLIPEEALEVTKIYSVAGLLSVNRPMILNRPFRSPHHSASSAALVGGGKMPRPGEISLSHRGILFLDELPEFNRVVLESLRQPLEDGIITVSRVQGSLTFPARFTLLASQNPCPCGFSSDPERHCTCSPMQIIKYQKRISGPLLDRIDLQIEVPRVQFEKLSNEEKQESSSKIRERIIKARKIQQQRFKDLKITTNTEMGAQEMKQFCVIDEQTKDILRQAVQQWHLSARSYFRLLKVARTIADLNQEENIALNHVAEALQYRMKVE